MAGRGKDAVLPAWMKQGKGGPAAPGSEPGPKPLPALARPAAPGSSTISSSVSRSVTGIGSHWTEHTAPNGRKYYYNSLLGKSSWEKPDELKTADEKALTGSLSAWKQFTAPDGRKYYYNSTTKQSSWEPPPELTVGTQVAPLQVDSSIITAGGGGGGGGGGSAGLSKSLYMVPQGAIQSGPTPHYSTVAEAKEAFRTLLNDAAIPSLLSWEDTVLLLAGDKRFGALKTVGERKAAFNEYIQHRRKEEAEVARAKQVKAKESFLALLDSCESLKEAVRIDPHHKANFKIATELLSLEPQWSVVGKPRALFDEWVEEKMEEEKEKKRIENRKRCENFARYLKTLDWINVKTSWREAEQRLTGVFEFEALQEDLVGRLEVWQDHMAEVEEMERKEREVYAIEQRRQERLNREEFKRKVLSLHRERGLLHHKMRWREYYSMISGEPALRAVEDNLRGSRPKELFMDVIEELEHEAEEAVGIVDQKLAGLPEDKVAEVIRASVALPCDEFWQLLSSFKLDLNNGNGLEHNDTITWRQGVWWECKSRVMREQQRKAERFKDLLRSTNEINVSSTFEQAAEICGNEVAWKEGSVDDDGRRRLFDAFITEKKELGLELEAEAQLRLSRKRRRKREKFSGEHDSYSDHSDRSSDDSLGGARRNDGGGGGHRRRRRYDKYRHRRRSRSRSKRYGEKKRDKEAHDSDREVEEGEVR